MRNQRENTVYVRVFYDFLYQARFPRTRAQSIAPGGGAGEALHVGNITDFSNSTTASILPARGWNAGMPQAGGGPELMYP